MPPAVSVLCVCFMCVLDVLFVLRVCFTQNIHIWDGNGSRQFLDNLGLTDREEGDLGPVYGFQWRHFGAEYKDMHTDYTGQGMLLSNTVVDCTRTVFENGTKIALDFSF